MSAPTIEQRPGYAVPGTTYSVARPVQRVSHFRLIVTWIVGIAVVAALMVGLSTVVTQPVARYQCPPNCGRPPTGAPVQSNPVFVAADGSFSVSYPGKDSWFNSTTEADRVTAEYKGKDSGTLQLFSVAPAGRSPRDVVYDLIKKKFPDFRTAYELPNAMVGYQPGYGVVVDTWPQSANGSYTRMRVIVLAAIKNDLALVAGAVGPYHQFGPDYGPGPPSGANVAVALFMGPYVNSFRWRGDAPR